MTLAALMGWMLLTVVKEKVTITERATTGTIRSLLLLRHLLLEGLLQLQSVGDVRQHRRVQEALGRS